MATVKLKRAATAGASLPYGELAIGANELYFGNSSNNPIRLSKIGHTHTFASLTSKPSNLSGYGITDAYTKTEVTTLLNGKSDNTHIHGSITNDGKIGTTAGRVLVTTTGGLITTQSSSGIDSRTAFPTTLANISDVSVGTLSEATDGTISSQRTWSPQILKQAVKALSDLGSNNYLTGVSGSGNGTVTFTRSGLTDIKHSFAHTHLKSEITDFAHTHELILKINPVQDAGVSLLYGFHNVSSNGYTERTGIRFNNNNNLDGYRLEMGLNYGTENKIEFNSNLSPSSYFEFNRDIYVNGTKLSKEGHTHDDRYYTETEIDTKLSTKENKINASNPLQGKIYTGTTTLASELDNKVEWTQVWSGSIDLNSYKSSFYSAAVPSNSYIGKRIAIEVQYGSGTGYTSKIIFGVLGNNSETDSSSYISRGIGWSYFDGANLRVKTLYAYTSITNTTTIYVGNLKTLFGRFSGTTIEWKTSYSETLYMRKIWVIA